MPPEIRINLSLLLKLAATSLTGIIALAACRKMTHQQILQTQHFQLHQFLQNLPEFSSKPPVVFIIGFHSHGKSSFLNTVCRVLCNDEGPLVFRAETAPVGAINTTLTHNVVDVQNPFDSSQGLVSLVDTPAFPAIERVTRNDVLAALRPLNRASSGEVGQIPAWRSLSPECVILVLRCKDVYRGKQVLKKLPEIVGAIREQGLQFVVVLTHKKAMKSSKEVEEVRKEVTLKARTDCVYCVENYTVGNAVKDHRPVAVENNFDTHNKTLVVMRQCIEFAALHRTASLQKINVEISGANRG